MSDVIQVVAIIESYIPNAMQDSYEDGGFESFDATKIRILKPQDFTGSQLTIFHSDGVPEESLWRKIGRQITFEIDRKELASEGVLFDGAVSNLR